MSDTRSTPHVSGNLIAASAGTGKTYQLTSRYLALMAMGVDPAAIVALTFTKKAAGEFRNRIFKDLADGALYDPTKDDAPKRNPLAVRIMETLSGLSLDTQEEPWAIKPANNDVALMPSVEGQVGAADFVSAVCEEHNSHPETTIYPEDVCQKRLKLPANLDADYFRKLLGKLVQAVNKLTLSTLDSFFQQIVSQNTLSMGVSTVSPVTGEEYEQAKRDGLHALLSAMERHPAAFHELYRDVSGEKINNMMEKLGDNVKNFQTPYHRHRTPEAWCAPERFALNDERTYEPEQTPDAVYYDRLGDELACRATDAGLGAEKAADLRKVCKKLYHCEFDFKAWVNELLDENSPMTQLIEAAHAWAAEAEQGCTYTEEEAEKRQEHLNQLINLHGDVKPKDFRNMLETLGARILHPFVLEENIRKFIDKEEKKPKPEKQRLRDCTRELLRYTETNYDETRFCAAEAEWQQAMEAYDFGAREVTLEKNLEALPALIRATRTYREPQKLRECGEERGAYALIRPYLQPLVTAAKRHLVKQTLRKTEGMFALMNQYTDRFEESILSTGRFTFDDITRAAVAVLSDGKVPTETAFDYTQRFRHWMLDEFQDTNAAQKQVLDLILEDVLQPGDSKPFNHGNATYQASGASLFVVGDVKQSIYGFRGGTPELLEKMLPHEDGTPNDDLWGQTMVYSELKKSFRSSPVIMGQEGFINRLFRGIEGVSHGFTTHESAKPERDGYVRISFLPKGDAEETRQAACEEIKRLIREEWAVSGEAATSGTATESESAPHEEETEEQERKALAKITALKGDMSVGILVRSNKEVQELYQYLHSLFPNLSIEMVSDTFVAIASPAGNVLMSFFQWLRHPADDYRRTVVQASPLGKALFPPVEMQRPAPGASREEQDLYTATLCDSYLRVAAAWSDKLRSDGYTAVVRELLNCLSLPPHARTASEWLQAAQQADAAGKTPDEWIRFIRQLAYLSAPSSKSIQIMTMHKSKGLEFDAVVLPFTSDDEVTNTRKLNYLLDETGEYVLLSPGGSGSRKGMQSLETAVERWKKERLEEEYNLLYVAFSRAKRANYVLLNGNAKILKSGKDENGNRPLNNTSAAIILRALNLSDDRATENEMETIYTLPETAEEGKNPARQWIDTMLREQQEAEQKHKKSAAPDETAEEADASNPSVIKLHSGRMQRRKVSPSKLGEEEPAAAEESSETRPEYRNAEAWADNSATDFGTDVHACFEQIDWLKEGQSATFSTANGKAEKAVRAALAKPEIAAVFRRPSICFCAYNEQDVDAIDNLDGQEVWVSGIIDRLVLEYDADGQKPVRAAIYDYKTNRIKDGNTLEQHDAELKKHYLPQMRSYCRLIVNMFDLPTNAVTATLIAVPSNVPEQAHLVPLQGEE